jgi:imidazolonepropionase-like amidohydrolase
MGRIILLTSIGAVSYLLVLFLAYTFTPNEADSPALEFLDRTLEEKAEVNIESLPLKKVNNQIFSKNDLLVENANLIDETETSPRLVSIYIQNGKIVDIGKEIVVPGVKSIDVKRAYVLPGLIDSHVHLQWVPGSVYRRDTPEKLRQFRFHQLRSYLASGVTSVLDTGISSQVLKEIHTHLNSGGVGPRVFALGPVFRAPNGYLGEQMRLPSWGTHWRAAETEEDIHQLFSEYEGIPDIVGVKVHLDFGWGPIDIWPIHKPKIRTIIERESKKRKLPIYAHAQEERTRNIALEMGAHTLVHHVFSPGKNFINRAKTQGTYLTTTLSNLERRLAYPNFLNEEEPLVTLTAPKEQVATARDPKAWEMFAEITAQTSLFPSWTPTFISHFLGRILWLDPDPIEKFYQDQSAGVLAMYQAGIPITVGSDSGNLPHILNMFHGSTTIREMELLQDAGMPPIDVLSSATSIPAKMMGTDHLIGTVEVGKQADLIVVGGNPTKNLSVLRNLLWVIKDGEARRPKEWMEQ